MSSDNKDKTIPRELRDKVETISVSVHESWMKRRSDEGWTYGEKYSAEDKTTPFMVDYELLPESEKEMDRITVRQVISTLIRLGYKIGR